MPRLLSALLMLALSMTAFAATGVANGNTSDNSALIQQAHTLRLAESPYWHVLLYYEQDGKDMHSRVHGQPTFFTSPEGEQSPQAELDATLSRWLGESNPAPDQSIACHFPARIAWLREQLGIPTGSHAASCPELETWLGLIKPWQATLVFPSAYLNNPSSMFGHTLLRIDAPDQTEDTRLLAYAVNYAAQTRESNGFLFAIKGLTGGYPGGFSLLPYYEKVKEYSDLENRDLWEYQLTLTPVEVNRLLLHLWEMRRVYFPYYFFSDNCSYELMWLLDAARPGLALHEQFPVYAIPVDTVRAVLAQQGMLKTVTYRASAATRLQTEIGDNSRQINEAATAVLKNPQADLGSLDAGSQARAVETAYDVLYYRFLAGDAPGTSPALRSLLLRRSSIDVPDQRPVPPEPAVDPAHGHATARIALDSGVDQGQAYLGAAIRPAYHDLLDPPGGYVRGARIDFLDTGLRYLPQTTQVEVDHITVIAIDSLTPRDAFIKPLSWGLATGQRRDPLDAEGHFDPRARRAVAYGEGQLGLSAAGDSTLCYAQIDAQVEAAQVIARGWRTGIGPRLGCLGSASTYGQWQARLQTLHEDDSNRWTSTVELGWQLQTSAGSALRVGAQLETQLSRRSNNIDLAWLHYF